MTTNANDSLWHGRVVGALALLTNHSIERARLALAEIDRFSRD